jgi:hypothetical protein
MIKIYQKMNQNEEFRNKPCKNNISRKVITELIYLSGNYTVRINCKLINLDVIKITNHMGKGNKRNYKCVPFFLHK